MKTGIKSQIVIVSAVAAVLLIVMSGCAIAESITFEKVAVLAASVLALNKCCGIILKAFDELLVSKNLGNSVPSGDNRYQLHSKILSCLRSREEGLE